MWTKVGFIQPTVPASLSITALHPFVSPQSRAHKPDTRGYTLFSLFFYPVAGVVAKQPSRHQSVRVCPAGPMWAVWATSESQICVKLENGRKRNVVRPDPIVSVSSHSTSPLPGPAVGHTYIDFRPLSLTL